MMTQIQEQTTLIPLYFWHLTNDRNVLHLSLQVKHTQKKRLSYHCGASRAYPRNDGSLLITLSIENKLSLCIC